MRVVMQNRVFDTHRVVAGQYRTDGGAGEALGRVGLEQVDPPVLGPGGGGADVEAPPALGGADQGRPLERLGPEPVLGDLGHHGEGQPVGRAGDHVGDAAARAERQPQPVGQVHVAVHDDRAGRTGPGPGLVTGRLDHHGGVLPRGQGQDRDSGGQGGSLAGRRGRGEAYPVKFASAMGVVGIRWRWRVGRRTASRRSSPRSARAAARCRRRTAAAMRPAPRGWSPGGGRSCGAAR